MVYNPNLSVPYGYGTAYKTLAQIESIMDDNYHPEYIRRFLAWLSSCNGGVGFGGGWRADGTQPSDPGFAPEGKSFHQNQKYNDGFIGATAVDVVAKNPTGGTHLTVSWSMVPAQGSSLAKTWGVHANVNTEAWHIQPIEIDGWDSWKQNGCPCPKANYPLPGDSTPTPPIPPRITSEDTMLRAAKNKDNGNAYMYGDGEKATAVGSDPKEIALVIAAGLIDVTTAKVVYSWSNVGPLSASDCRKYLGSF